MEFTQYFEDTQDIPMNDWNKITEATKELVEIQINNGIPIVNGYGGIGTSPEINDNFISLNGEGEDSHESFYISREDNESFCFCKTAQKPYNTLVVAILTIVSDLGYTEFSSDGDDENLEEGRKLGREIFSKQQTVSDIPAVINNIKERILFNDVDNPDSGYLVWSYGSQFAIYDKSMVEIDTFNVSEAVGDEHRAKYEAEQHFKAVR